MNWRSGTLVAVQRPAGPPKPPFSSPDLFCLMAATSNVGDGACACRIATDAAATTATINFFMAKILVGLGPLGVVDHEDVHAVAHRFELETELVAKRLKDSRSLRPPLDFPVELAGETRVIDDRAIEGGARQADQQVVERHRARPEMPGIEPV